MIKQLVDQFFADLERDSYPTGDETSLRAWLWFTCPAHLRSEVEPAIRADARWRAGHRTEVIRLRVTASEREAVQKAADEAGQTLSQYIRERLEQEAGK